MIRIIIMVYLGFTREGVSLDQYSNLSHGFYEECFDKQMTQVDEFLRDRQR
ncbi:hypothetical protein GYA19_06265 [Candidatus Beckwithbacteria bacterium]|nr:hypothetical protein [Candidatus Beckwithbacteria bacterium]